MVYCRPLPRAIQIGRSLRSANYSFECNALHPLAASALIYSLLWFIAQCACWVVRCYTRSPYRICCTSCPTNQRHICCTNCSTNQQHICCTSWSTNQQHICCTSCSTNQRHICCTSCSTNQQHICCTSCRDQHQSKY